MEEQNVPAPTQYHTRDFSDLFFPSFWEEEEEVEPQSIQHTSLDSTIPPFLKLLLSGNNPLDFA